MASTIAISDTINWVIPQLRYLPLDVGTSHEPAKTMANTVLQTIVGPPFRWRWNRKEVTFSTIATTADYLTNIADLGFLEHASYTDASGTSKQVQIVGSLGLGNESGPPQQIALQTDDNAGGQSFRLVPVPDAVYTITLTYQKKPALITTPSTDKWSPVPDEYSYIYNYGMLALGLHHLDDPRWQVANQRFVAHLLGASEGLSESERNMFLSAWMGGLGQSVPPQTRESVRTSL